MGYAGPEKARYIEQRGLQERAPRVLFPPAGPTARRGFSHHTRRLRKQQQIHTWAQVLAWDCEPRVAQIAARIQQMDIDSIRVAAERWAATQDDTMVAEWAEIREPGGENDA